MTVKRKNVRACQVLYSGTYYDVLIAVDDLSETDSILQDWALDKLGHTIDLPSALVFNKDITEVLTSLNIDNYAYIQSAVSAYMDMPSYAGLSGTLPTFPTSLVGGLYVMPELTAFLYSLPDFGGYFGEYTIPAKSFALSEGQNYIGVRFNSGIPEFVAYTDDTTFDYSSIIPAIKILNLSSNLYVLSYGQEGYGLPEKLFEIMKKRKMVDIISNFTLETSTNYIELSALTVNHGVNDIDCLIVDTSVANNDMFLNYKDSNGDWQKNSVTQINNTQYQSASGLGTLAGGEFVINYVYRLINATSKMLMTILSGKFATLALAKESDMITDIPDIITENCILVGRIIVEQGSSSPVVQKVQKVSFGTIV